MDRKIIKNLHTLPANSPVPVDDGACDHLLGSALPPISLDHTIYQFTADEIKEQIEVTYDLVVEQIRKNYDEFVWKNIKTVESLDRIRIDAMNQFLGDYPNSEARYVAAELPTLLFDNNRFGIALCSHSLFLYSEQFPSEFHIQSIKELCKVASEVRIFPLLELGARKQ